MNFTAIDFETANPQRNSACSVGLVRVENGIIVEKAVHLIKPPGFEFTFTHIHGLTWIDVMDEKNFGELWPEIERFTKGVDFLVAHNASFDKSVLEACLKTAGIALPLFNFRCTLKLSKEKLNLPGYKLSDVCKHFNIELNHHEALSDAHACAQIMLLLQQTT